MATAMGIELLTEAQYRELQKLGLKRMFLHAARLDLSHPLSGEPLALEAPLPAELAGFLRALGPGELDHD